MSGAAKNLQAKPLSTTFSGEQDNEESQGVNNTQRKILALLGLSALSACSTLSELRKANTSARESSPLGSSVVIQAGASSPLLSTSDDKTWIQLSEVKEHGRDRMNGLLATGNWQQATEEARRELEKKPGDTGALTSLAAAYALGRNYEMAGYYANVVLKTQPSSSDALNIVGLRFMMAAGGRRSDFEQAIALFKQASEGDGTHVAAALNLGYLLLDLGDAAAASDSFSTAKLRCGRCFDAEYGYGLASMRSNQWAAAKTAFESSLQKDPSKAASQYQLALVMHRGFNDPAKGIKLLQDVVSDPDGRFKNAAAVKRAANITLRRWRASDRSGPEPQEAIQPPSG